MDLAFGRFRVMADQELGPTANARPPDAVQTDIADEGWNTVQHAHSRVVGRASHTREAARLAVRQASAKPQRWSPRRITTPPECARILALLYLLTGSS